ncbi:MAG: DUF3108 domain-containing protein [Hyphomicrobiales bacterium]
MKYGKLLLTAFAAGGFLGLSGVAQADEPIALQYDLYVAGIKVYQIGLSGQVAPNGFKTQVSMRPAGLGSIFSSDQTDMRTTGTVASGQPKPANFEMRLNERQYKVSWSGSALPTTYRSKQLSEDRDREVTAALNPSLTDPLTAVMRLALSDTASSCALTQRVYNGKEIYEFALSPAGAVKLDSSSGGAYLGPAKKCKLAYRTIAGYSQKVMKKNQQNPPDITLLVAPVKGADGKPLMVIVGGSGTIDGRSFTARLSSAALAGKPLQTAAQ